MATTKVNVSKISDFPKVTPAGTDYILVEKDGQGGSITLSQIPVSTPVSTRIAGEVNTLNSRIDNIVASSGDDISEIVDARQGSDGTSYASLRARLDAENNQLKGDLDNLKKESIVSSNNISDYLFKENAFMSSTGVVTPENGYSIYKISLNGVNYVNIRNKDFASSIAFWSGLGIEEICGVMHNGTYTKLGEINHKYGMVLRASNEVSVLYNGDCEVYFNVKDEYRDNVVLSVNSPYTAINETISIKNSVFNITEKNAVKSYLYFDVNSNVMGKYGSPSDGYFTLVIKVSKGDEIKFSGIATGANKYGSFTPINGNTTFITESVFKATEDGIVIIFAYENDAIKYKGTFYPKNSIKIDYDNVVNPPNSNEFKGLKGVAFGTSLTYRAQTTGGYLQYLPNMLEMEFDNQGVGSATIYPFTDDGRIYNKITSYSNYSNIDVCILEGFVNDWYQEAPLGTYTDNDDTSVCGRVRKAINYIMSQNSNITIFLVLDHFGRLHNTTDESSTVIRGGKTQYEYYEEISKVAESLGVPVVKQYAISRINENTPQYFLDDIHMNDLGARQSANSIYSAMKQYSPNV